MIKPQFSKVVDNPSLTGWTGRRGIWAVAGITVYGIVYWSGARVQRWHNQVILLARRDSDDELDTVSQQQSGRS